jgi:hypothetical protein
MTVKISKQVIVILRGGGVALPFLDVEMKQGFIAGLLCGLENFGKVSVEVFDEMVVKFLAEKVRYSLSAPG